MIENNLRINFDSLNLGTNLSKTAMHAVVVPTLLDYFSLYMHVTKILLKILSLCLHAKNTHNMVTIKYMYITL